VMECCPCNPNKPCSRPDCHDSIEPDMLADLAMRRVQGEVTSLPARYADPNKVIVYRSYFDSYGFCDLQPLTSDERDPWREYRDAYRRVWLDDLGGYEQNGSGTQAARRPPPLPGLEDVLQHSRTGVKLIDRLCALVRDQRAPAAELGRVNKELSELDRAIEQSGFHHPPLGPLTRMFVFGKENIVGSDPISLASQMREQYLALERRGLKLRSQQN